MADGADTEPEEVGSQSSQSGRTCAACGKECNDAQPYRFVLAQKVAQTSTVSGNTRTTTTTYEGPFIGRTLYFSDDCVQRERRSQLRTHLGMAGVAFAVAAICFGVWAAATDKSGNAICGTTALIAAVVSIALLASALGWLRKKVPEKKLKTLFDNEISAEARRLMPQSSAENIGIWWLEDFRKGYPDKQITWAD